MRVTAETRSATRQRILEASRKLFAAEGFEGATTRDIARAAGIAAGTLFNYFPTKEAVVRALVGEACGLAAEAFEVDHARRDGEPLSLEEELFAHVAAVLRKLKPVSQVRNGGPGGGAFAPSRARLAASRASGNGRPDCRPPWARRRAHAAGHANLLDPLRRRPGLLVAGRLSQARRHARPARSVAVMFCSWLANQQLPHTDSNFAENQHAHHG
jgi:AcrR family transcriptional regulator